MGVAVEAEVMLAEGCGGDGLEDVPADLVRVIVGDVDLA